MFYLKYRPQTLLDIDNESVRTHLVNILEKKQIPHAWLLTGTKGTGKTSTARIIAKAINCDKNTYGKKGDSIEPCNSCSNCTAITAGSALDVIEIDAASNRKIDDIRALIEQVKFAPVHMRYKVYIIDEVHMLTTESFNALLKTLEEPPASTIFLLATTEIDKLPKTIISRCLRLAFSKAEKTDVMRQLKRIVTEEKLSVPDDVLEFIATHCDHSFRDAAKLLEEVVSQNVTSIEKARQLLGMSENHAKLMELIEKADQTGALEFIEGYDAKGGSIKTLIELILDDLHQLLLVKSGVRESSEKNNTLTLSQISSLIKLLTTAYNTLRISPIEALPLEIALVEYFAQNK